MDAPEDVALEWVKLVLVDGDIPAAWPLTDANLRLCLVQGLIHDNLNPGAGRRRLDELARALSEEHPTDPNWPAMQRGLLRILRGVLPITGRWAHLRPRPVDPVHQIVVFLDAEERSGIKAGESAPAVTLLMAFRDQCWRVAGFTETPPEPGWPPKYPEGPVILT